MVDGYFCTMAFCLFEFTIFCLRYMQYAVVTPETIIDINRPQRNEDGTVAPALPDTWDGQYR